MRIFLIHQFFKTPEEGGGIRSWYLTRALQQAGHEIIVLTGKNTNKENRIDNSEYGDKNKEHKIHNSGYDGQSLKSNECSIQIIRLPVSWTNSMSFWQRIFAFIKFLYLARKESKKHKYDLVYAISVPITTGLLAIWTKKPFVFEVGDLWPDVPVQMKILRNPILKYFSYRLEKKIYKKAQLIISLSIDIQRHIYQKWPFTANIVVENFCDLSLFNPSDKKKSKKNTVDQLRIVNYELSDSDSIVCTYVGTAGVANDLMQMVDLAKVAKKEYPNISFYMMISGKEEKRISKAAPSNMIFIDYGSKEKVAELLAISDFNFVTYAQYSLLGTGSPNKFFDGIAAGCITVINIQGWIQELVLKEDIGIHWDIKNHSELLNSIKEISNNRERIKSMKDRALTVSERFNKNVLTMNIVDQIEIRFR